MNISFVLFPQASEPSGNFNIILPMGLFIPVILVIPVIPFLTVILGPQPRGYKTKEMYYSLLSLKMISFVLFPQASEPSVNFIIILPMGLFIPVILVI